MGRLENLKLGRTYQVKGKTNTWGEHKSMLRKESGGCRFLFSPGISLRSAGESIKEGGRRRRDHLTMLRLKEKMTILVST